MLLIVVDAYSKWLEVKVTNSTTTAATIAIMDELFARYGAPVTVVSDNGPQFTAADFKEFLKKSGVKFHKLSAPYHPATNGQAERYVQTTKDALKAMDTKASSLHSDLNNFLQQYRRAPHATTGEPPCKLFLGRNFRTRFDLLKPEDVQQRVSTKQQAGFEPTYRKFTVGQLVYFLSGNPRMDRWIPGVVAARLGDLHYEIDFNGKPFKRHVDQMRSRISANAQRMVDEDDSKFDEQRHVHFYNNAAAASAPSTPDHRRSTPTAPSSPEFHTPPSSPVQQEAPPVALRRSMRQRRPPQPYSP